MAITKVSGRQIELLSITNAHMSVSAALAESKLALNRPTRSLVEMKNNDRLMLVGEATVLANNPWVDVVFAGAEEFDDVTFYVQVTRLTEIPLDLYIYAVPGVWVSDKAVTGFRINLVVTETTTVVFDYLAIGTQA